MAAFLRASIVPCELLLRAMVRALGAPLSSASPSGPADAIVILGAPLRADGQLSAIAEERVRVGVDLWERGIAPVLCMVGGHCPRGHRHGSAEADGMARWVRARGVPEEAIRVDRLSTSTFTNALRAAELLLPEGRRRVWLVTQPFHLRRARYYFRRAGFEPLGWHIDAGLQQREPARALRWIVREYGAWAILPFTPHLQASALGFTGSSRRASGPEVGAAGSATTPSKTE